MRRFALLLAILPGLALAQGLRFRVVAPKELLESPFTGRVVVYLGKRGEPRFGPNWFDPQPTYSASFVAVRGGDAMIVESGNSVGFPGPLSALEPGRYRVQAVIDRNLGGRAIGTSPGNIYSKAVDVELDPGKDRVVDIVADQIVKERAFVETDSVKEVRLESKLLSAHYRRPTFLRAAVVLPKAYAEEATRRFPVFFEVPGFGGTHFGLSGATSVRGVDRAGEPFIHVVLNPDCPTGHSVFADSANNGPWGRALTTELIPEIDRRFRTVAKPGARFVGGHSSGGWSSLWLQVTYPETFGGCWSTSPDPVDFRAFQLVDIYAQGANLFTGRDGKPVPIARFGDEPVIFAKRFSDMERPIRGEQLGSFEAVFSPRGADGEPAKLWNRETGAIDPKVAEAWKAHDIGLILRTRWKELAPKLAGKVHVYMGDRDTFYLEGAVKLLKEDLARIGADAVVELFPGDHGSVMTQALIDRIDREVAEAFRKGR